MINHVWSILCRSSSIDQENNSVSIFNTLDYVLIHGEHDHQFNLPMDFEILSMWVRSSLEVPAKGRVQILFKSPTGEEIMNHKMAIDCSATPFFRSRMKYPGLPVKMEGCYSFQLEYSEIDKEDWTQVATLPLFIQFAKEEPSLVAEGSSSK
jgi:hypothetical protein